MLTVLPGDPDCIPGIFAGVPLRFSIATKNEAYATSSEEKICETATGIPFRARLL